MLGEEGKFYFLFSLFPAPRSFWFLFILIDGMGNLLGQFVVNSENEIFLLCFSV